MAQLYRKAALERISNPDQLDKAIAITSPASWLMLIGITLILVVVIVWSRRFDPDDYSNPSDFPVAQAYRWLVILLVNMTLCWTGAVLNDPTVLAVIQLIIAASCVVFVISALHPHRNRPVGQIQDVTMPSHPEHLYQRTMSATKRKEIIEAIKSVVEKQEPSTCDLSPMASLPDMARSNAATGLMLTSLRP